VSADRSIAASLIVYGLAHAVVDALSAGVVITAWQEAALTSGAAAGTYFVLYNALAFGAQPLIGLLVDAARQPRTAAMIGCGLTAASAPLFAWQPWLAVVVIGLGNATFHLGAGSIALQLTPRRAAAPGIFVAPGAIGLFAGTLLGRAGTFVAWPFLLALACLGLAMVALPRPATPGARPPWPPGVVVTLALVLTCIAVRSLVGFAVVMPWKSPFPFAVAALVVVVLGKALGGVVADRVGWGRTAVGALALAAPLLAFGPNEAPAGSLGLFLVNLTMPVTLVATANLLPGRPAFAFGLSCLALEVGAWPVTQWSGDASAFGRPWAVFAMTAGAAVALYLSLRRAGVHE